MLPYEKYTRAQFDQAGLLEKLSFEVPDDYNFAYDVLDDMAGQYPDYRALVWVNDDKSVTKTFTFAQMRDESMRTAAWFTSLGIKKGDKVLLILRRHYSFWFCMMALTRIGAVAIPATNQLLYKDIVYRLNKGKVKALVCTGEGDVALECEKAEGEASDLAIKIIVGDDRDGWLNFEKGIGSQAATFDRPTGEAATSKDELMLMYFTSGTTGYPRLAAHAHTYSVGHITTARYWQNCQLGGLHLTISDTGWGKAVWGKLYGQWMCGSCIMAYDFDRFNSDAVLNLISEYKITTFCAPPTMYRFFIKEDLSHYDLSSLTYACTAGEALNAEVFNRFKEYTGISIMEGFGQTETTLTVGNYIGDTPRPGSMGRPNPAYDLHVVDENGLDSPDGETGEIVINVGENPPYGLFREYLDDSEAMARVLVNGVYHTGDTAWRNEDGYLFFVGRTDDLIKSSGYRISPFEIESVIMEIPYVLECAAIGVPDEVRGHLIKAIVVLTKGVEGTEELKKEIQDYVKTHTAPYKYPRIVEFMEELPKTISGKIRKVALRESHQNS